MSILNWEQILPLVHNVLKTETDGEGRLRFRRFTPVCSLIRNFVAKRKKDYERQNIYQFRLGVEAPVARQGKLWCAGGHSKITDNGSRTDTVGHTVLPEERYSS